MLPVKFAPTATQCAGPIHDTAVNGESYEPAGLGVRTTLHEAPFSEGMLCPKGVKRYLQGSHPDRVLTALARDPAAPGGFSPLKYEDAIQRVGGPALEKFGY